MTLIERATITDFAHIVNRPEFRCLGSDALKILTDSLAVYEERFQRTKELLGEVENNHKVLSTEHIKLLTELSLAREVQQSFLPNPPFTNNDQCEIGALSHPASIVGGDFFDVIDGKSQKTNKFGRLLFAIGDSVGHGMPAALNVTRVMTLVRAFANRGIIGDFSKFISEINFDLLDMKGFTTMEMISYDMDTGKLTWCSAGQDPPKIFDDRGNNISPSDTYIGPPMGIMTDLQLLEEEIVLSPGEIAVFATDGAREAFNKDGVQLDESLDIMIQSKQHLPPQIMCDELMYDIHSFTGKDNFDDDITFLVIKRKM